MSNAIIFYDTLPPICIEKVVCVKTEEVLNTKTSMSPHLAPTIILKTSCQKDGSSEAAASSSSRPIQPNQSARPGQPVILKSRAALDQQNMLEDVQKDNEECYQGSTGQPVVRDSGTLNFRIQGLSHSTVEEAEHVRVRELLTRIESHSHRDDLQTDLMQDNVYNPFSENSKKMIHDMGNVEHFELCETDSQAQCSYCLSYWAKGIVYCTCGICLCHTEVMRRLNRKRFDALAFSNYVIKKGMFSRSSIWKI